MHGIGYKFCSCIGSYKWIKLSQVGSMGRIPFPRKGLVINMRVFSFPQAVRTSDQNVISHTFSGSKFDRFPTAKPKIGPVKIGPKIRI